MSRDAAFANPERPLVYVDELDTFVEVDLRITDSDKVFLKSLNMVW